MMGVGLVALLSLLQPVACAGAGATWYSEALDRAATFDLAGAIERLDVAPSGCQEAKVAAIYARGLLASREAYGAGGSPESLEPVRAAIAALESLAGGAPGAADVSRTALLAAAAAAQSERDEMWLLIEHTLRLEDVQLSAGQPGAPLVTAHELAGELWLQVHRYEDAGRFFTRAAQRVGRTLRVTLGLARSSARLNQADAACDEYATFVRSWGSRPAEPPEVIEARAYLVQPVCQGRRLPTRQ